jgi:KDO2-lipid IV(A) lauroyltransferase
MTASTRARAAAYTVGWATARRFPARATYAAADRAAVAACRRAGKGVRRLRANYARIRPDLDPAGLDELTCEGMKSYLRYYVDVFRLPNWSRAQICHAVRTVGDAGIRADLSSGRGAIVALGHQGNWDLAGAWATLNLGPVTTVAERLEPPEAFEAFLAFRQRLGLEILALGDDGVFTTLLRRARAGHVVPLLVDRDLSQQGLEIELAGHPARMAKGPATLAELTGLSLYPVSTYYERLGPHEDDVVGSGHRLVIRFHSAVPLPESSDRDARIRAYTQSCADSLSTDILAQTQDWHMLARVFSADLDPR